MKTSRRHAEAATSITYHRAPECWNDGFPLGNGFLGAMLWGDGKPLSLTLDCADLWDLRIDTSFMDHPDYNYGTTHFLVGRALGNCGHRWPP